MTRMMVRLSLIFGVLAGLLTAAIPVLSRSGFFMPHERPSFWTDFGFGACELPCWAGVTPGQTAFERAPFLLEDNLPGLMRAALVSGSQINVWAMHDRDTLSALIFAEQERVGMIRLQIWMPVEILIGEFGAPDCVWVDIEAQTQYPFMELYWAVEGGSVAAGVSVDPREWTAGGGWLEAAYTAGVFLNPGRSSICEDSTLTSWRGFAPSWRYVQWVEDEWAAFGK